MERAQTRVLRAQPRFGWPCSKDQSAHLPPHIYLEDAYSLDAHKVRAEEATARRRDCREYPEGVKLKRTAKGQRGDEQVSVLVVVSL